MTELALRLSEHHLTTSILLLRSRFQIFRNSQASDESELPGRANSPATGRPNKSLFLLCIHAVREPTMTAVSWPVWQYPAGSLGWSGHGLWSQSFAKKHTGELQPGCAVNTPQNRVWTQPLRFEVATRRSDTVFFLFSFFKWFVFNCPMTKEKKQIKAPC